MKFVRASFSCAALAVALAEVTAGQSPRADAGDRLGVSQIVDLALARNAELQAARRRTAEAQGLLRQAGLRPRPSVDFELGAGRPVGSRGEHDLSVGYSHVFELGGKRDRRLDVAGHGIRLAELEIADRERLLRAEVKTYYADALAARRNLETATELAALTDKSRDVVATRVRVGDASALDEGLLRVEAARLRSDRFTFESQAQRAMMELRVRAGLDAATAVELEDAAPPPTALTLSLDEAIAQGLERRPDLSAARLEETVREAELRLARADAVPDLVGTVRYSQGTSVFDRLAFRPDGTLTGFSDRDRMLTGGVSIALPFRNKNQGNIQAAQARVDAARLRREFQEQLVRADIRAAYVRHDSARRTVELFQAEATEQSRRNLELVRASYDLGETRLLDFIAEQRRLIDVQQAYAQVLREYAVALAELERATGAPLR